MGNSEPSKPFAVKCATQGLDRVVFMISYVFDPKHWQEKPFGFKEERSLDRTQ